MKVFILTQSLTEGGAQRGAVTLANGLAQRGHDVFVFADLTREITYQPLQTVHLQSYNSNKHNLHKKIYSILTVLHIRRFINKEHPDAIIGIEDHFVFVAKLAVLLSGLRIPVFFSDRNSLERPAGVPMPCNERFYKFYFSRCCSVHTVLTQADKKVVENRLKNVVVMPNPLGISPCKEVPVKSNTILSVGRLGAWHYKGFDILINAWSKIESDFPDWTLTLVGGGTECDVKRIRRMMQDAGVEGRMNLVPFTQDIIDYYREASIFVLSSRYEGFGQVLIEAMSQGCACVACDYKGRQKEIIEDGTDGLICEPENADILSERIARLIKDKALRHKIQQEAIKSITRFSPAAYAESWEKLLISQIKK